MIIHPAQIVQRIARIICGDEHGTGFFITPSRLVTARHVIIDHILDSSEIQLQFQNEDQSGFAIDSVKLIAENEDLDIAILEMETTQGSFGQFEISLDYVRHNEEWETFGYPFTNLKEGLPIKGTVLSLPLNLPYDIALISDDVDSRFDYSGLSGSPLLIKGHVFGIVTWSTIRGLGAVSIKKLYDFLLENQIPVINAKEIKWSNDFADEIANTTPNAKVISKLNAAFENKNQYYLLYGPPGSGKSIVASTIHSEHATVKVLGRYIIRIPGDPTPIFVKASKENFLQWMEDLVCKVLTGEPAAVSSIGFNERITRLSGWLEQLNDYLNSIGERALIVVDGIDEILSNGDYSIDDFLNVLPPVIPSQISILLSCISEEILPVRISSILTDQTKIYATPMSESETIQFLNKESSRFDLKISIVQITLIAQKSEGHPLYLRYIIETLRSKGISDYDEWIDSLSTIDGDIKIYYERLWSNQINTDADRYWITLIASQLRGPVTFSEFKEMLPESAKYNYQTKFGNIKHLFKTGDMVSIYHSSFQNFVIDKSSSDIKQANKYISDYNLTETQSVYSLKNRIHHLLLSPDPSPSILYCNQNWVDDCAMIHVEPDRIISDINKIEALCINQEAVAELIRVKLLLQRVRFRYNNVLAEYAFEITDALIELGKPAEAINYILRDELLLVSLDDSIYFLQKLYETEAHFEASLLNHAIDIRFKAMLERASKEGNFAMEGFVYNAQALTLRVNIEKPEDVAEKSVHQLMRLKDLENSEFTSEEDSEKVKNCRHYIASWHAGYYLHRFNLYAGIEKMAEFSDDVYTKETTGFLAKIAINYHRVKEVGVYESSDKTAYLRLVADIEKLATEHGYQSEDSELLIKTLIEDSKNPVLIEEIIKGKTADRVLYNLRKSNGVDADTDSLVNYFNENIYLGYIDKLSSYPSLAPLRANSWEAFFKSAFELTGFIQGKIYRLKAESRLEEIGRLEPKGREIVNRLNFTLLERTKFDRSYQLIEEVVPIIYHRLTELFLNFEQNAINWFTEHIISQSDDQLGQYTEGYRKSIYLMAETLSGYPSQKKNAFSLLKVLEQHIYLAVQNRWQRTSELLQIVQLYARIGSKDRAGEVYKNMLDTSMGPSWYKEAQFELINSVLVKMKTENTKDHFNDFAGYLEFAAGEMTFQRYVQSEMHSFIGTLADTGNIREAVEYFKFQLLPSTEIILENAESSTIDAPSKGDGYILGAKSIIEASAILNLLSRNNEINPFIKLALSEVFLIGSDTSRYLNGFADLYYEAYLGAEEISDSVSGQVLDRIAATILSERMTEERSNFIIALSFSFEDDFIKLENKLSDLGVDITPLSLKNKSESAPKIYSEEEDAEMAERGLLFPGVGKMSNFPKISKAVSEAETEFEIENKVGGLKHLIDCLKRLSNDGADIWMGRNLTSELGDLFKLLKDNCSAAEVMQYLTDFILEHITDDWRVVNALIGMFENKISDTEKEKIVLYIKEHIEMLIRSNSVFTEKYEWLNKQSHQSENSEILLVRFLIWLLNHPYASVRNAVLDSISWLVEIMPEMMLHQLMEYSVGKNIDTARELCSGLLAVFSSTYQSNIWNILKDQHTLQESIFKCEHLMIRINWLEVLESVSDQSGDAKKLYENLKKQFPTNNLNGSDVFLDNDFLNPIDNLIENLNDAELLNASICEDLIKKCDELFKTVNFSDHLRVEQYVERSFYEEDHYYNHTEYLLRSALNNVLSGHIGIAQVPSVSKILKLSVL
ncbi:NACHT domain-containing protein [Flavobacterium anhuiense]|uniref:NACHT domain-containing protein n=1 Tax=Flavobacterium anhuiense TaxID=459526 RepID=A0ABY0LG22_9FLAO|nr:trypsin-like peptidase domain-containing protein [Flavobacterium anhuiense]SCY13750.1 NACHT domain-containing protein [Flavobacterium anhuiense]